MSANFGAAAYTNFYEMAMIPRSVGLAASNAGQCSTNVDGQCITGGVRLAGPGGVGLSSSSGPQCVTVGLFAGGNKRYANKGWTVTRNTNPLRASMPLL